MKKEAAVSAIASFAEKRVLVVGDLMLDEYLIGEVHRISPEAPVPVIDVTRRAHVPGGAANVAANVAALGGMALVLGITGDDESAERLREALQEHGVETAYMLTAPGRPTITKTRIVSGQQQIVRMDCEPRTPLNKDLTAQVLDSFTAQVASADACIFSDYGKGLLTTGLCEALVEQARRHEKPVVIDPKGQHFAKYAGCTVITPNLREAELAAGITVAADEDLERAAEFIRAALGGDSAVLITRGADGMTLFRRDQAAAHAHAITHEVFDVTGAGDTVGGTVTLGLAAGMQLEQAMLLANLAASVVVQKSGTATLTAKELIDAMETNAHSTATDSGGKARTYLSVPRQKKLTR